MRMPLSLIAVALGEAWRPPPDKRGAVVGRRQLVACTDAVHGCVLFGSYSAQDTEGLRSRREVLLDGPVSALARVNLDRRISRVQHRRLVRGEEHRQGVIQRLI